MKERGLLLMAGIKPKPTAVKKLEGNLGKRKRNQMGVLKRNPASGMLLKWQIIYNPIC